MEGTEQIKLEVIKLWKDLVKPSDDELMPMIYAPLKKDAELLFVGLNPSFGKFSFLKGKGPKFAKVMEDPEKFYAWKNEATFDYELAQEIEEIAREKHRYFALHQELAERLCHDKKKWEHVDLFFSRMSKQSELEKKVFVKDTPRVLTTFGMRQLELSRKLMSEVKPKMIVVVNSLASKVFKCEFAVTFDEKLDCCMTRLGEKTVPTIFTSLASPYIPEVERRKAEQTIEKVFALSH